MQKTTGLWLIGWLVCSLCLLGCPAWFDDGKKGEPDGAVDGTADGDDGAADLDDGGDAAKDGGDEGASVDDLASLLEPHRAAANMPALAAAVFRGEELVAQGVVGVRVDQGTVAAELDDLFHLGSCTKAMTATLAATLVEEGLISWDTTLAEAFPSLAGQMHPDYQGVTLAQLMAHRGGTWIALPDHTAVWLAFWTDQRPVDALRLWFVEQMLKEAPESTPGSEYAYSNAGYMVVGAALEQVTGQTWEALMQERLFGPLGMASCGFGPPGTAGQQDQPWGHSDGGETWQPWAPETQGADNPPALGPAGTVHCSLRDWGAFAAAHLAGAQGDERFLPAAAWTRMHTRWPGQDYALGWGVADRTWAGGDALVHAGTNTRWFATVWIAPAKDTLMLAVTNCDSETARNELDSVFVDLIPLYLP